MKKSVAVLLVLALLVIGPATASAMNFYAISQIQYYMEKYSASVIDSTGPHRVIVDGTIKNVAWSGVGNHYDITLQMVDTRAMIPLNEDLPTMNVHFRLHKDEVPFKPGDEIEVDGTLNIYYSSVMVPWILADYIDGSDDF